MIVSVLFYFFAINKVYKICLLTRQADGQSWDPKFPIYQIPDGRVEQMLLKITYQV